MGIGFHVLDDSTVILRTKGVYKQVKAYQRKGRVYAGYGNSFVALTKSGTSNPNVNWDEIDLGEFEPKYDKMGHMYTPGSREVQKTPKGKW